MFSKDYQNKTLSYVVVLTLLRNVIRCTMAFTIVSDSEECACTDFIDDYGFGNCTRKDTWFGFQFSCYVNDNSTCNDMLFSRFDGSKRVSAKACVKQLERYRNVTAQLSTLSYDNRRVDEEWLNEKMNFVIPIVMFITGFGLFMYIISFI